MKWIAHIWGIAATALLAAAVSSCELFELNPVPRGWNDGPSMGGQPESHPARVPAESDRKVLLVYSAGYNSLRSYLKEDIEDLWKGYIPGARLQDDVLLVFSHLNVKSSDYTTPTERVLFRLTKDREGKVVSDTLLRLPHGSATSRECLSEVLGFIKDSFPARNYGMIFSSHGSGWFPPGYYSRPEKKYFDYISWESIRPHRRQGVFWPEAPDGPAVKSIGQEQIGEDSSEMTLREFAEAFPMHFDYILIDACLMGGVEVAYAFRDVCDGLGFSQAEVLADGFDYTSVAHHLLENKTPDPVKVCSDYYDYYNAQSGSFRSATISFIACTGMEALAARCKELFSRYRTEIAAVDYKKVQNFGRRMNDGGDRSWYFDLKDVLVKAGASEEDLASLQASLDECIVYKAATPVLLGSIPIKSFSGLTMYLPAYGTEYLDAYYKENISWNDATELVQ